MIQVFFVSSIHFNGNTKVPESLEHRQSKVICSKVIFLIIIMFITLIIIWFSFILYPVTVKKENTRTSF